MFTSAQLAAAVSPETAVIVTDYPYGYHLRCNMRVWVEFKRGKGFRYCTQTSNPKREGVWNAPKCGTYSRVSMAIAQDEKGHLSPAALSEYSNLSDYAEFIAAHDAALCDRARGSFRYFWDVKSAYENKRTELGVDNIYNTTPENRAEIQTAYVPVIAAHVKAGTDY